MGKMIKTIAGDFDESQLSKTVLMENVPCGKCFTTQYHLNGTMVRQDVKIEVDEGVAVIGTANI